MELTGYVSHEDWGKRGLASSAAKLYWNTKKRNQVEQETPYSQFWINPDPETLCTIVEDGMIFGKFLEKYPEVLGRAKSTFDGKLPLLVKVLSIENINPMQLHPGKDEAEKLHKQLPTMYPDKNHKPKIIVALKGFEMLYGLRQIEEIKAILIAVPELSIIIPFEKQNDFILKPIKINLRDIILYWLTASEAQMKFSLDMFFERMEKEDDDTKLDCNFGLIKRLHEQKPYNPGVYGPFFLNHIIIWRDEAVFIDTNIPYCFLSGDCLQVSTRSRNNVPLAFYDKKGLSIHEAVEMMDLNTYSPEELIFKPVKHNENVTSYRPPVKEFAVDQVEVRKDTICTLPVHDSCSIFLVTKGKTVCFIRPSLEGRRTLVMGSIVFLLPYQKISFTATEKVILYHVYPNV